MKAKLLTSILLGWALIAGATGNKDQKWTGDGYYNRFYQHIAVSVENTSIQDVKASFKIVISKAITVPNPEKNIFVKYAQPAVQVVDGPPIWTITSDQFPITEDDCDRNEIDYCDPDEAYYCYDSCLTNLSPALLEFDEKANKLYFMVGASDIGTGGGSSFILSADVSKKEIKLLTLAEWGDQGILSISGRYLIIYGSSVITVCDTQTNTKFDINKNENDYQLPGKQLYHSLEFQHWLSETQFSYIDVARYYIDKWKPDPFVNAKEIIYDIATKKVLHERMMTAEEVKAAGIEPSL